ncbi:MAG: CCA tRNA nucleotidyltransferase, partial [Nitrospirota bacterium]
MHSTVTEYLSQLSSLTFQTLYLVGGSVRDLLLHKQDVRDIDVIIQSGSEAIARVFADKTGGNFFFLDEKRKITRVVKHSDIGVVQFDFADFAGHDLAADLGRRDFTINAMALELKEFLKNQTAKNVIDLFQGREDIRERLVRVIKPEVLDDDPLRLLRAVRFAATL